MSVVTSLMFTLLSLFTSPLRHTGKRVTVQVALRLLPSVVMAVMVAVPTPFAILMLELFKPTQHLLLVDVIIREMLPYLT